MVNQAEILYAVYTAMGTLTDMTVEVPVYGHPDKSRMVIANGILTLYHTDGTVETYPEK
jgi:hypothetical protein